MDTNTVWKHLDPFTLYRNCPHFTELMRGKTGDFEASLLEDIKRGVYDTEIQLWWDTIGNKQRKYVVSYDLEGLAIQTKNQNRKVKEIKKLAKKLFGDNWKP